MYLTVHTSSFFSMPGRRPRMAHSPGHSGMQRISGHIRDSTMQVRVGTYGSSNGPTHNPAPQDRLSSFSIHYTNIRGLNSNFTSVETHLATTSPNLFLLSETQLSRQSSPDPFQISRYNLYSRFHSKGGVCAYCNIKTPIARLLNLESPHFDVLRLKIYLTTTTIILCFCYCSPNATDFLSFFEYLTSCHESLLTSMYTTLTSSNPPTLMLGELRLFISLFPTSWNKLSNIQGVLSYMLG